MKKHSPETVVATFFPNEKKTKKKSVIEVACLFFSTCTGALVRVCVYVQNAYATAFLCVFVSAVSVEMDA